MGNSTRAGELVDNLHSIMRAIIVFCAVLGLVVADPFLRFAQEHGKQYKSRAEYNLRKTIFMENYESMMAHNARFDAGEETWTRKVTPNYDWTQEEFESVYTSGIPKYEEKVKSRSAPDEWNWVSQGGISSVKNQGQCGSR